MLGYLGIQKQYKNFLAEAKAKAIFLLKSVLKLIDMFKSMWLFVYILIFIPLRFDNLFIL